MKTNSEDFNALVEKAMKSNNVSTMRPVIEKELLHYDILFCLDQLGLLDNLVFQGGTSLRLCYGGNRFSEDLDFAGGHSFSSSDMNKLKECIQDYLGARYSLEVEVKEPRSQKNEQDTRHIKIEKWQISINTTPEQKEMPKQRIKLEIANIPAYTKQALPLQRNYDFLPDGYEDTLVYTETLDEIMADKLIAFPATTRYIRYRDIWDLAWLKQQGAQVNTELVLKKQQDYKLTEFNQLLHRCIEHLDTFIDGEPFKNEMRRFIPLNVYERTLGKPKFLEYLKSTHRELFTTLHQEINGNASKNRFEM